MKLGTMLSLALAVSLWSCREEETPVDQPDAVTCDTLAFTPCGGDIVGAWSSLLVCGEADYYAGACADTTVSGGIDYTETITFTSTGEFELWRTTKGTKQTTYSTPCLEAIGGAGAAATQCSEMGSDPFPGYSKVCVYENAYCTCNRVIDLAGGQWGEYSTSGTTVTRLDYGDPTPWTWEYCVDGDTLTVSKPDGEIVSYERQ